MWHVTHDTSHMTHDTRYMINETWPMTHETGQTNTWQNTSSVLLNLSAGMSLKCPLGWFSQWVAMSVCPNSFRVFFCLLILPFTKVKSQIDQLQKDSFGKKLWNDIGLRICNLFQSKIAAQKKVISWSLWAIRLCIVGELAGGGSVAVTLQPRKFRGAGLPQAQTDFVNSSFTVIHHTELQKLANDGLL